MKRARKPKILVVLASESDLPITGEGFTYLKKFPHESFVGSVHRDPVGTISQIEAILDAVPSIKVIIAVAHTATGLPGIVAGLIKKTTTVVIGVRRTTNPQDSGTEDGAFNLSAMPFGVPMLYAGYNEQGFTHACLIASDIILK
jgi:phosphoribosylcarboxyaminoimidazole (NCAIR) mutase